MARGFSWRNWIDAPDAVLAADAEAGELVVANLAERQGYKVWRTANLEPGATDAGFVVDFGRSREVQTLMLLFPRDDDSQRFDPIPAFAAGDTVRHRLSNLTPGANEVYDSGAIASGVASGYGYHHVVLDEAATARYWRCDLDAVSRAALGYVDVARAWAGPAFIPRVNFDWGDAYVWQSDGQVPKAARGFSEFPDNVAALRAWTLNFGALSNEERNQLLEFERLMNSTGQFLVWRGDYEPAAGIMLARQQQSLGLSSLALARNSKAFRLIESL
jgi:hypothetical protein